MSIPSIDWVMVFKQILRYRIYQIHSILRERESWSWSFNPALRYTRKNSTSYLSSEQPRKDNLPYVSWFLDSVQWFMCFDTIMCVFRICNNDNGPFIECYIRKWDQIMVNSQNTISTWEKQFVRESNLSRTHLLMYLSIPPIVLPISQF